MSAGKSVSLRNTSDPCNRDVVASPRTVRSTDSRTGNGIARSQTSMRTARGAAYVVLGSGDTGDGAATRRVAKWVDDIKCCGDVDDGRSSSIHPRARSTMANLDQLKLGLRAWLVGRGSIPSDP